MAAISSLLIGIGAALSAVGTVVGVVGARKQAKASAQAEELRKRQMELEASRARRETIRKMVAARSVALNNATSQGAQGGSGLQGGFAQITSQASSQQLALNQNTEVGRGIFDANARADRAGGMVATGQGMQSLGGMFLDNANIFGRIG